MWPRTKLLDFSGNPDHNLDPIFFLQDSLFTIVTLKGSQKVMHENRRWKFEVSEC